MNMTNSRYRAIPQMQKILESKAGNALCEQYSRQEIVSAIRIRLDTIREQIRNDEDCNIPDFLSDSFFVDIHNEILSSKERSLKQVVNATGIILHTNLGRAPIAEEIIDAIKEVALGYSNLEFNLDSGKRGSRYMHIECILKKITGAEAAIVVNNCAAAVLVSLNTLAKNSEVIVSRSELIEIGDGFRMPDVIAESGAIMKEVGTTNKTRLADYEKAISENTTVILSNHCSNYRIIGFTESPETTDLVELAHSNNLLMVKDLGSGALLDLKNYGISNEPSVQQLLNHGVDVVMFSGDKLMGGPQAGIIVGRKSPIAAIKQNPLIRALRIDKLTLAALEATLDLYLMPEQAIQRVPILRMISEDKGTIKKRAHSLLKKIKKNDTLIARIEEDASYVGGGSAPMDELPTYVVKIKSTKYTSEKIAQRLRKHTPAIIGRISDNFFVIDLRTVFPDQLKYLSSAIETLL